MGNLRMLAAAGCVAALTVSGCSKIEEQAGYVPADRDLKELVVGQDTVDTVRILLGRPSAEQLRDPKAWYYVRSDYETYLFRERKEVDREVVAITFDDQDVLKNVERFGLQDGQVVALSRRVTESNIEGITFLQQLFGNLGNFTLDQFINGQN